MRISQGAVSPLTGTTVALPPEVQQEVLEDGRQVLVVQKLPLSPFAKGLPGIIPKQNLGKN